MLLKQHYCWTCSLHAVEVRALPTFGEAWPRSSSQMGQHNWLRGVLPASCLHNDIAMPDLWFKAHVKHPISFIQHKLPDHANEVRGACEPLHQHLVLFSEACKVVAALHITDMNIKLKQQTIHYGHL
eukprot:4126581-Amphidinium_carterae.1